MSRADAAGYYESERLLSEYLLFHYGTPDDLMPWEDGPRGSIHYPVRCAEVCLRVSGGPAGRVLDLGCSVGRSSLEMSRWAGEVIGIDLSTSFIGAANALLTAGSLDYAIPEEGGRRLMRRAELPEGARAEHVSFRQGDACDLADDLGQFDGALLANLLCRLPDPAACLRRLVELVRPGGWAVLATPCSWSEEFTPRENWLGGSGDRETLGGIRECLEPAFSLESREDMPFVLREHRRKYQWTMAEVSTWRRN